MIIIESISALSLSLSIHGFRLIAEWVRSRRFSFCNRRRSISLLIRKLFNTKIQQLFSQILLVAFQICVWPSYSLETFWKCRFFFFGISHSISMLTDVQRLNCQRFSHGAFFKVLTIFWSSKSLKSLRGALYPHYKSLFWQEIELLQVQPLESLQICSPALVTVTMIHGVPFCFFAEKNNLPRRWVL